MQVQIGKVQSLIKYAKESKSNLVLFLIRYLVFRLQKKRVVADTRVEISDLGNLTTGGELRIGIDNTGFSTKFDRTFLNLNGILNCLGDFSIGKGCRFDIAKDAFVELGKGGYVIGFTNFIISYGLKIGDNCAISWGCQFLDNDFHEFEYAEKKNVEQENQIVIGSNVWIGNNVFIYKGVRIPDGCIIASNSVVKSVFNEENVLIAGNPAKIIKRSVIWNQ